MVKISRLKFDEIGKRKYETGVEKVVIYRYSAGNYRFARAWNGVTAVTSSSEGGEATDLYADDLKYLSLMSVENWKGTIEAYHYPDAFAECLGEHEIALGVRVGQQTRKHFGLCWTTIEGNDTKGNNYGYKVHLLYDVVAAPSDKTYQTQSDSPEPISMSWDLSAGNVEANGHRPTAIVVLDYKAMAKVGKANVIRAIEDILFGTDETSPTMPTFQDIETVSFDATHLMDSDGNYLLDSKGDKFVSQVFE